MKEREEKFCAEVECEAHSCHVAQLYLRPRGTFDSWHSRWDEYVVHLCYSHLVLHAFGNPLRVWHKLRGYFTMPGYVIGVIPAFDGGDGE